MKKRFAAIFMAAALAVSAVPYSSFAADADDAAPAAELEEAVDEAVQAAEEEIENAEAAVQEALEEAGDAIDNAAEEIADAAEGAAEEIAADADEAASEAADAAAEAGDAIAEAVEEAADAAEEAVSTEEAAPEASSRELSEFSKILMAQFDSQIDEFKASLEKAKDSAGGAASFTADISLTLEDSVKSMLGMFVPADISWLSSIDFRLDFSFDAPVFNAVLSASVNETPIVSVKALVDSEADAVYLQSPELSETCLSGSLSEITEALSESADVETSTPLSEEDIELIKKIVANAVAYNYDPETFVAIYRDIMEIVLTAYQDQGSEEEPLTAGGITQSATKYTATITMDSAMAYVKDLMFYLRDSEPIAKYFEAIVDGTGFGMTYGDIQTLIDDALGEINSVEMENGDQAAAEISMWVNEEGKPIGVATIQQMEVEDTSVGSAMIMGQTQEDDKYGFLLNGGDAETVYFTIEGAGQAADGILSGEYGVNVLGYDVANIKVSDYDTVAAEKGYVNGTYEISLSIPPELDSDQQLGFINNFGLIANIASDESSVGCKLSVTSADVPLVTLGLSGAETDAVEGIDPEAAASVIDFNDSEALEGFFSEINPMVLIEKLTEAGMPEDFIDSIMSIFS